MFYQNVNGLRRKRKSSIMLFVSMVGFDREEASKSRRLSPAFVFYSLKSNK
jgi:hypothetical protein